MNIVLLLCVVLTTNSVVCHSSLFKKQEVMNITELSTEYGHKLEQYEVVTEDGYILTIFRLPGTKKPPVLLMHGIASSADDWLLRGNESLPITLADSDHDVWLGNVRGNRFGRRHVTLNPDKDPEFWDFSFYEYGHYDLTSIIDLILSTTGADKLDAIGHSQGNTIFYVLGSTRPEYNEKVNVMIALAPVCYLDSVPAPLSILFQKEPLLDAVLGLKSDGEVLGDGTKATTFIRSFCTKPPIVSYLPCVVGLIDQIVGYDKIEIESDFFSYTFNYFPTGTSRKNLLHFGQVYRRHSFSNFDYGTMKNVEVYGLDSPPVFDLSVITMPVVLLVGQNDKVSTIPDVEILRKQLPNVRNYTVIDYSGMNHIDFMWGKHMYDYLFPLVFDSLEKKIITYTINN